MSHLLPHVCRRPDTRLASQALAALVNAGVCVYAALLFPWSWVLILAFICHLGPSLVGLAYALFLCLFCFLFQPDFRPISRNAHPRDGKAAVLRPTASHGPLDQTYNLQQMERDEPSGRERSTLLESPQLRESFVSSDPLAPPGDSDRSARFLRYMENRENHWLSRERERLLPSFDPDTAAEVLVKSLHPSSGEPEYLTIFRTYGTLDARTRSIDFSREQLVWDKHLGVYLVLFVIQVTVSLATLVQAIFVLRMYASRQCYSITWCVHPVSVFTGALLTRSRVQVSSAIAPWLDICFATGFVAFFYGGRTRTSRLHLIYPTAICIALGSLWAMLTCFLCIQPMYKPWAFLSSLWIFGTQSISHFTIAAWFLLHLRAIINAEGTG